MDSTWEPCVRVTDSIYSHVSPCSFFYHTTQHTSNLSHWIIIISYQFPLTTLFPTKKEKKYDNCYLRRYHLGHSFASSWCFPQVWLRDRVLDLFVADSFWLSPWDTLCYLCYHQVNFKLCGGVTCERQYVFCFSDLGFVYSR